MTLLPSIEHVIFIGDHLQLRPQAENYEFSVEKPSGKRYDFDISLFERLVAPKSEDTSPLPSRTLVIQRRMHPEISKMLRSTLYPRLVDAPKVSEYPLVPGMRKRVFWYNHNKPEADHSPDASTATSKSNDFEVDVTVALVMHLQRQDCWKPGDIAVLTPYMDQMKKLTTAFSKTFNVLLGDQNEDILAGTPGTTSASLAKQTKEPELPIRIATVDNFQGEEAKCVVISLVRSNQQRKCGFLRTTNRINVLLSRAQHGMYLIGNTNTYSKVEMWKHVIQMMREEDKIGNVWELRCPRHPEKQILMRSVDAFVAVAPEGGCDAKCGRHLNCGHVCPSKCHSDVRHGKSRCRLCNP